MDLVRTFFPLILLTLSVCHEIGDRDLCDGGFILSQRYRSFIFLTETDSFVVIVGDCMTPEVFFTFSLLQSSLILQSLN